MKVKELQSLLKKDAVDLLFLVYPDPHITWLSQKNLSYGFLLIKEKSAQLYISKLDHIDSVKNIALKQVTKKWKEEFKDTQIKKVAVNKESLSAAFLDIVKELYPKAKIIDFSEQLKSLRMLKTEEEVKKLRDAAKIADNALQDVVDKYSPKKFSTEVSVSFHLEKFMKERGAEPSFPTIVASKANAAVPHHETGIGKIKQGPLLIDMGAKKDLYCSDMTRVLIVGKLSKGEKEKLELLKQVQADAVARVKEGLSLHELDKATRKALGKYSSYFFHSLGHGIGVEVHEAPRVSPDSKNKVQNNMVFTIEPGIYFPQKHGFRIEDTLVFQKRAKILTKFSKENITLK